MTRHGKLRGAPIRESGPSMVPSGVAAFAGQMGLLGILLTAALLLGAAPAYAGKGTVSIIGSPGSAGGELTHPTGVAVRTATGDLYVSENGNNRVSVFDANGEFMRAWGWDVVASGPDNTGANERQQVKVQATAGTFKLKIANLRVPPNDEHQTLSVAGGGGTFVLQVPNDFDGSGTSNAHQTVIVTATGGTFTLSLKGEHTPPIVSNASAVAIENALQGLETIGSGNVSVSGPAGGPWDVEFGGTLAASTVPQMGGHASGLSGESPRVAIEEGQLTSPIARNALAGQIQGELEDLSTIGPGNVSVTGPAGGPWDIRFTGTFGATDVRQLRVNADYLTGELESASLFDGQFSALIERNANAAELQAALEALETIGPGNVVVSGVAGGPWDVEFVGSLASNDIPSMEGDPADLTGSPATLTITTSQLGGGFEICSEAATCKSGSSVGRGGALAGPTGIAIDQATGDVYVVDWGNRRVEKYDSAGNFILAFARNVNQTTEASVCTAVSGHVCKAASTGAMEGQFGAGDSLSIPGGWIALSPDGGTVFVTDPANARIQTFTSSGDFKSILGKGTFISGSGDPAGIALGTNQRLYTTHNGLGDVKQFTEAGSLIGEFAGEYLKSGFWTRSIAVDAVTNRIYAQRLDSASTKWEIGEFDTAGKLIDRHGIGIEQTSAQTFIDGLAVNSVTGEIYVSQALGDRIFVLDVVLNPPISTISPASNVTGSAAKLNGTVNPNGGELPTGYRFEYRPKGGQTWTLAPKVDVMVGSGTSGVPVSQTIGGLEPNRTYEVRLVATRQLGGGTTISATTLFTTSAVPPVIGSLNAAPVTDVTARIQAPIDARNSSTTYYFEYGTDTGYGTKAPATLDGDAGSGGSPSFVFEDLSGLLPQTVYHYRLVAENSAGKVESANATFSTRPTGASTLPERAYELVNQPDKGNQNLFAPPELIGLTRNSTIRPITPDGNGVVWAVSGGAPGGNTGTGETFRSNRQSTGWTTKSLVPPASEQYGGGNKAYNIIAANPSFTSAIFSVAEGVLASTEEYVVRVNPNGSQDLLLTLPADTNPDVARARMETTDELQHLIVKPTWFEGDHLYDYGTGSPEQLDIMPNGMPSCGILEDPPGSYHAGDAEKSYHYTSIDGSTVYFGATDASCSGPAQVYLRDRNADTTELVSTPPVAGPAGDATFIRANADGRRAVFLSSARLTGDDGNSGPDLYLFARDAPLTCLTCAVGPTSIEEVVVSEDLSRIYFLSTDALVAGGGIEGQKNLYVLDAGGIDYVTTEPDVSPTLRTATRVSSDGRVVLFSSRQDLTADSVGQCSVGNLGGVGRCIQLYRYDDGDGSVECLSCNHHGATNHDRGGVGGLTAGFLSFQMSEDGSTVAFSTKTSLVPRDVNKALDIYQWRNGSTGLITDGATEFPDGLGEPLTIAISNSGRDVFFTVAAPLTGFERDRVTNMYDARVEGGFTRPVPSAPCVEDSCQGALDEPPSLAGAGSSNFVGSGNERQSGKASRQNGKARKCKRRGGRRHKRRQIDARTSGTGKGSKQQDRKRAKCGQVKRRHGSQRKGGKRK